MEAFFSHLVDDYVVDGICKCGHLESEHGSEVIKVAGKSVRLNNSGSCCCKNCECMKFTWIKGLKISELASQEPKTCS